MNNVVDLHTLSHQIHRENILNYCCPMKLFKLK